MLNVRFSAQDRNVTTVPQKIYYGKKRPFGIRAPPSQAGGRPRFSYAAASACSTSTASMSAGDPRISDIVMPGGMNGFELISQARAVRGGLKALATSG
jgi:hypothetical protein